MINKTVLSLTNENSKIFLNIVDNRIEMWLGSVTSSEIQSIYNFIISKKNLIKKSFTTIIDLTDFIAKDDSVHESMNIVQNLFTEMGWGNYARVKKDENHNINLHKIMKDGFFTSIESAHEYLNEWRRNYASN